MMDSYSVFLALGALQLKTHNFDEWVLAADDRLIGVFFWGHHCPNCEVAKRSLFENLEDVRGLGIQWFHVNVYEDGDLGTRFALHGIPTFFFFRNGKKLGRISPFPGIDPFLTALRDLHQKEFS